MTNQAEIRNSKVLSRAVSECLKKPLGQILIEAGLISINQLEIALREQQESGLSIGEMMAIYGWIDRRTTDFFADRWKEIIQKEEKKPLVYYFQESGLLTEKQVKYLLEKQRRRNSKSRFHHLVVEEGLLKQVTVDYFLTHLFGLYSPNPVPLEKPFEIIKDYVRGQTNFKNSDLEKVPLMNVSLKGIKLDESNLRKANFHESDLSYSSFVAANLSRADLSKTTLREANLGNAVLKKANLRDSNLEKSNFRAADLQEADLRDAYLKEASFEDANLQGAKLMLEYAYDVYYNERTTFDPRFSPELAGWRKLNIADEI
ncbi:MAG: pentapeptide repeat-containing protein [Cyanobacteria bacterium P01_G01_bin.19]